MRMKNRAHVSVSWEFLSNLFFEGNPVTGIGVDHTRDMIQIYLDMGEDETYACPEGCESPQWKRLTTDNLDEYEVYLVKKSNTEE